MAFRDINDVVNHLISAGVIRTPLDPNAVPQQQQQQQQPAINEVVTRLLDGSMPPNQAIGELQIKLVNGLFIYLSHVFVLVFVIQLMNSF